MDELYPTIGFEISAVMKQEPDGRWYFEVKNHILGPDDIITKRSQPYESKKTCLFNFIGATPEYVKKTLEDL